MQELAIVILAAGKGTRMPGDLPKVLHPLAGRPLLDHVLASARAVDPAQLILVLGYHAEQVRETLSGQDVTVVLQQRQLGTGDAVMKAGPSLSSFRGTVLVLYGDVPLLSPETIRALLEVHHGEQNLATILTATVANPHGYGRILRDALGRMLSIREQADLEPGQEKIAEINSGIMALSAAELFASLAEIRPTNRQGEYYLTDVVAILRAGGGRVGTYHLESDEEVQGVNTVDQLRAIEEIYHRRSRETSRGAARWHPADRIDPRTGLLKVGDHACLAVDRPGFNSGQLIVFPKRPVTCWLSLHDRERHEMAHLLQVGEAALRRVYRFDALNFGWNSGAGEVLAIRLIPRWAGDLNFLPLVSGIKAVPESPAQAWSRLHEVLP
jgi:NDP-sugar pyrophosphorylase family protein/diadenosine tetraphosphate (Ap4A) HIT family hydrolase